MIVATISNQEDDSAVPTIYQWWTQCATNLNRQIV